MVTESHRRILNRPNSRASFCERITWLSYLVGITLTHVVCIIWSHLPLDSIPCVIFLLSVSHTYNMCSKYFCCVKERSKGKGIVLSSCDCALPSIRIEFTMWMNHRSCIQRQNKTFSVFINMNVNYTTIFIHTKPFLFYSVLLNPKVLGTMEDTKQVSMLSI